MASVEVLCLAVLSLLPADDSKYGTFVKKQQQGATEQRIPTKQPFQLQQGDILRFGTKCRYKLQQVALNICVTGRATADAELAAAAAKCNARLVECCSGGAATHCIATDQDVLTPAALYSLVNKIPVVTPQWLTTVAAGKVYANELQDTEPYTPKQLLLPGLQDKQQQQRRVLDVLKWQMPSNELLTNYHLVLPRGRQVTQLASPYSPWYATLSIALLLALLLLPLPYDEQCKLLLQKYA